MTSLPSATASRYQPLVVVLTAMASGIALTSQSWTPLSTVSFPSIWCVSIGGLAAWWWFWRGGRPAVSAWLLVATIASSGGAWYQLRWELYSRDDIGRFATLESTPACLTGTVLSVPEVLPAPLPNPLRAIPASERCRVDLQIDGIRDVAAWIPAAGRSQLVVDGDLLAVEPGDRIQVFAQLRQPRPPINPGEFDFAARARADGRLASLVTQSPACVTVVAEADGWPWSGFFGVLRARGEQTLRTYVGPEQAGLASAVLLGNRADLPYEATLPYFLTGTVHLLVVSGLNVAILATGLYALVWIGWLPRRIALALTMIVVAAYALVTGTEPPVLRAAMLVLIVCLAAWSGRRPVAFNTLSAAAILALAFDPTQLFHTGTQLSFLCVAILVWTGQSRHFNRTLSADPLDQLIASTRPWYEKLARGTGRWVWFLLLTSAAVWLFSLPLVLARFHIGSPISIAIAPAVWALALVAMWSGFVTLACGFLIPFAAVISGAICAWSLYSMSSVVLWAEKIPGSHFWAPGPSTWWLVGFYLGLVAIMIWGRQLIAPRWQLGFAAAWIVIGLVTPLARHITRDDEMNCTFVAMGHGTCVVLEMPDGRTMLYDAGSLGSPDFATDAAANFLWHRGIRRIDGMILSHADVDHYNAVPGLLKRFDVEAVYVSPMMFDWFGATGPPTAPQVLEQAIRDARVPLHEVWSGDRLQVGEVAIEIVHPPRQGVIGSDNANSITAVVEYRGRRLMLPGDLETPGLDDLIADEPIDCDVLMAPHHGSRRSDPPGFAAWSTPEWVVISGGSVEDSTVEETYSLAGAKVFNTGKQGAIEFTLSSRGVSATSYRSYSP